MSLEANNRDTWFSCVVCRLSSMTHCGLVDTQQAYLV